MKTALLRRLRGRSGPAVGIGGVNFPENTAAGVAVATLTPLNAVAPGAISIVGATTPANAITMHADGRTVLAGSEAIDFEVTPTVTATVQYTHDGGVFTGQVSIPITNVADGPTAVGASATLADMIGTPMTGVTITGDLRTLFGPHPLGLPQTCTVNFGTVAGDNFTWTWTPSVAEQALYGEGNVDLFVRATDPSGQFAEVELLDQSILPVVLPPVASNTTLLFRVLAGAAPVLQSSAPADNATNVTSPTIALTYDKPVRFKDSSATVTIRNVTDANDFDTLDPAAPADVGTGDGQMNFSGSVITIDPASTMPPGKVMAVKTSGGPITNLGGIAAADITTDTALNFTVAVPTLPGAIGAGDWTFAATGVSGQFAGQVNVLPSDNGAALTEIVFMVNGTNHAFAVGTDQKLINIGSNILGSAQVFARNAGGDGPLSVDTKTDTAYVAAGLTTIQANAWETVWASPPTIDPVADPRTLVLTRQGYDSLGTAITSIKQRLLTTARIRQAYPNQASLSTDRVSLEDFVYSTDTVPGGVTNNSSEVSPKPEAHWVMTDRRVIGNTLVAEVVAFHRDARNGEPVACVEFTASDGTTTVTQKVSSSEVLGGPTDYYAVIGYRATIDISSLANPSTVTLNAKVYPHIGASGSIRDSSAAGASDRTFAPRTFRRDTALFASPYYVYVNATTGNDTTGVVSQTAATAEASPCLTIGGALNKLHTARGASGIDGSEIRLMAGTHVATTNAPTATRTQNVAEVVITRDPNALRSAVIFQFSTTSVRYRLGAAGGWLRFKDITVNRTGTTTIRGETASKLLLTFENVTWQNNGNNATIYTTDTTGARWIGCDFTSNASSFLSPGAAGRHLMMRGCTVNGTGNTVEVYNSVGNHFLDLGSYMDVVSGGENGTILAFNRCTRVPGNAFARLGEAENCTGACIIQNVIEFASATSNTAVSVSADSHTGNMNHILIWHNTIAGFFNNGRSNLFYDETTGLARSHKLNSCRGNLHVSLNHKSDVFKLDGTRTGAWSYGYGVGCFGEYSQFRDAGGTGFKQDYPGLGAKLGASQTVRQDPLFANYQATTSGPTAGTGGGNYAIGAGSPAKAVLTKPCLKFDATGAARSLTAASAGAYE